MRRLFALAAAMLALLTVSSVAAQDATPAPRLDVPGPEECRVEPVPMAKLAAAIATPSAAPAASPTPFAMPPGAPADAATVSAITATAREFIACLNAGDNARVVALFSESYLRRFVTQNGPLTERDLAAFAATPAPLPSDRRTALIAVRDVRVLADGRVGALVVGDNLGSPAPPRPVFFVFVRVGDRWLIDDIAQTGVSATPAA